LDLSLQITFFSRIEVAHIVGSLFAIPAELHGPKIASDLSHD
jgi:hypothetical protein